MQNKLNSGEGVLGVVAKGRGSENHTILKSILNKMFLYHLYLNNEFQAVYSRGPYGQKRHFSAEGLMT